jgi:ribosome-binding protein aMBF1 (putative translation factor)
MTVRKEKRRRLEAKGWKLGTTRTFLKLTPEETAYIEMKLRLASSLRERRQRGGFTQGDLAKRLRSSQSRVAKMEAGDPSVSLDLLFRSLFILGASASDLSRTISARSPVPAA